MTALNVMADPDTIEIAGKRFPKWLIYLGGGVLVVGAVYLLSRNRPPAQPVQDGMLAEEYNQRLKEYYEQATSMIGQYPSPPGSTTIPETAPIVIQFPEQTTGYMPPTPMYVPVQVPTAPVYVPPTDMTPVNIPAKVLPEKYTRIENVPAGITTESKTISSQEFYNLVSGKLQQSRETQQRAQQYLTAWKNITAAQPSQPATILAQVSQPRSAPRQTTVTAQVTQPRGAPKTTTLKPQPGGKTVTSGGGKRLR